MKAGDPADPLTREAIDWLIRLAEAPDDVPLRAAADAWRRAEPGHALAWTRAEKAWSWLADPELAPDPVAAVRSPAPRRSPCRDMARRMAARRMAARRMAARRVAARWAAGALGAVAAALLLFLLPSLTVGLRADLTTATAELRRIELEEIGRAHV